METLLKINDTISVLIALFCLVSNAALFSRARKLDQAGFYVYLFFTFLAVSMLLENRTIYTRFDSMIGYPNLAWLLGWGAKILAICFISLSLPNLPKIPLWLGCSLVTTAIVYMVMFVKLRNSLEQPVHLIPNNGYELVFIATSFTANALVCIVYSVLLWRLAQGNPLIVRARWMIGVTCGITATAFFLTRIGIAVGGSLALWSDATLTILFTLSLILTILPGVICIPLASLSNRLMVKLTSPFLWLGDVILCCDLDYMRSQLDEYCPTFLSWSRSWRNVLRWPTLYCYQMMMDIFDRRKVMTTYLLLLSEAASKKEQLEVLRSSHGLTWWDISTRQKASKLLEQMNTIDENDDFARVMHGYQQLGISLRKNPA